MKYLTQDEIKRLIREIPDERQKLMVLVGYYHGLRVSELTALTPRHVSDGYLIIQRLKGSEKTTQRLSTNADQELDESVQLTKLCKTLNPTDKLFPITRSGAYKMMRRAGERAGIPWHKCHPHALKHSCAMSLINVFGIHELKEFLGHKSLNSTGAYLNPDEDEVSKKAAAAFAAW